jgi:hypothetical protein
MLKLPFRSSVNMVFHCGMVPLFFILVRYFTAIKIAESASANHGPCHVTADAWS